MAKFIGTGGDSGANASISGSTVNFRTSPNTSASVITTLPKNKRVLIIDSIDGWYFLLGRNRLGFIFICNVRLIKWQHFAAILFLSLCFLISSINSSYASVMGINIEE